METGDLIRALAADVARGGSRRSRLVPGLAAAGGLAFVAGGGEALLLGLRADVLTLAPSEATLAKLVGASAVLVAAGATALRLASPGRQALGPAVGLAIVAALIGAVGLGLLDAAESADLGAWPCGALILLAALPGLGASLVVLEREAPTRPGAAGATAGLFCAGAAACGYALHCPTGATTAALWYGAAALSAAALGALLGRRVLAW